MHLSAYEDITSFFFFKICFKAITKYKKDTCVSCCHPYIFYIIFWKKMHGYKMYGNSNTQHYKYFVLGYYEIGKLTLQNDT